MTYSCLLVPFWRTRSGEEDVLVSMGFSLEQARFSLEAAGGDVEAAVRLEHFQRHLFSATCFENDVLDGLVQRPSAVAATGAFFGFF